MLRGAKIPTNTLKDALCKGAKAGEKLQKLYDGGGLFLAVLPSGAKIWRLAYRFGGKPKTKAYGPYPAVSLAEARVKRDEDKALLRDGIDPMADRKAARSDARAHGRGRKWVTLREASDRYWTSRKDITDGYRDNALRGIEMHLCGNLGDRDVASITRADLLDELSIMDAAGHHVYVRKVRMWVGQVFEWAVNNDLAEINPAALIRPEKTFGKAKVENFAALELREMPDFMQRIGFERDLQSVLACRLLAMTWVRTTELRMMEWSEIDEAAALWLIPAGKMKRSKDHLVPLSIQALEILRELKARSRGSHFVFASDRRLDRPMSENAILYLIYRIGYKGRLTGHGFRSIGSTWANERGYNADAIERQLAHVPESKVRSAYNRAAYIDLRRQMLQDFADWLDACSRDVDAGRAQGRETPA